MPGHLLPPVPLSRESLTLRGGRASLGHELFDYQSWRRATSGRSHGSLSHCPDRLPAKEIGGELRGSCARMRVGVSVSAKAGEGSDHIRSLPMKYLFA